ncbi:MAG TPA: protein kinase [Phycisphaerales bacterium]|nr:protein kinase [Phycisphaerales bacterium]HMP38189.1 protein kinase [Phycisphaerales bacterium]
MNREEPVKSDVPGASGAAQRLGQGRPSGADAGVTLEKPRRDDRPAKADPDPSLAAPRLRELFMLAIDLAPEERAAALDAGCGSDTALRRAVEELLAVEHEGGGFLSRPAGERMAQGTGTSAIGEDVGAQIGPYRLLEELGEGGFGRVFLAEQAAPVRRRVALKILKPGMDTRRVVARFEAERQALAMMSHPNIARVLEAGATTSGRPYFVMEHVVGSAITAFADAQRLDITARLRLFLQVCHAVQHAHTKGIIHRDIKPSNVLASMADGRPTVKVIDFGIAKATGSGAARLTDKTLHTLERQMIGTPEYMSPEQAMGSSDIDTGTDVYALGVLLYELLTGTTPFDSKRLRSASAKELEEIFRDEDPPTPSSKLSRSAQASSTVARNRRSEAPLLESRLRGELDWIAMKALERDRTRRYESPGLLAADIERHLAGDAVTAAPPSIGYRIRTIARRHRAAAVAGSVVLSVLLLGMAGTAAGLFTAARRADGERRARLEALAQRDLAERARDDAIAARLDAERAVHGANVRGAQTALASAHLPAARSLLARCPESERHFEWRWLHAASRGAEGSVDGSPLLFSPCGSIIVTSSGSAIVLSDVRSLRELGRIGLDSGSLAAIGFAPAGDRIALGIEAASGTGVVQLHSVPEGALLHRITGEGRGVSLLQFDRTGRLLATATGAARALQLWDASSGTLAGVLDGHLGRITSIDFDAQGTRVVTGATDGGIRIWDVGSGRELARMFGHTSWVTGVWFAGDGLELRSHSVYDRSIRTWDAATGEQLRSVRTGSLCAMATDGTRALSVDAGEIELLDLGGEGSASPIAAVTALDQSFEWSPDGRSIISLEPDGSARVHSLQGWRTLARVSDLDAAPIVDPSGERMAVAVGGRTLIGLIATAAEPNVRGSDTPPVEGGSVRLSPSGKRLLVNSQAGSLRLVDVDSGALLATLDDRDAQLRATPLDDDRIVLWRTPRWPRLATEGEATRRSRLQLLEADGATIALELVEGSERIVNWALAPANRAIATLCSEGLIRIWDLERGGVARRIGPDPQHRDLGQLRYSPAGTCLIATNSSTESGVVWNVASGAIVARPWSPRLSNDATAFTAFAPEDRWLVVSSATPRLRIVDPSTGEAVGLPLDHATIPLGAAFSGRGAWLRTMENGVRRFWEPQTGTPRLASDTCDALGYATSTITSPDGRWLAAMLADGNISLHDHALDEVDRLVRFSSGPALVAFCFDRASRVIVTADDEGTIRLWELARPQESIRHWTNPGRRLPDSIAISPDASLIAAFWGASGTLFDSASDHAAPRPLAAAGTAGFAPEFTADGARLVGRSGGAIVLAWDVATGEHAPDAVRQLRARGALRSARYSEDHRRIVAWTVEGDALLLDGERALASEPVGAGALPVADESAVLATLLANRPAIHFGAVDAGVRLGVTGSSGDRFAYVRELVDGTPVARLGGHVGGVRSVAISADGSRVVAGSAAGGARLWSAAGDDLGAIDADGRAITAVAISPRGDRVVVVEDRRAWLWIPASDGAPSAHLPAPRERRSGPVPDRSAAERADGASRPSERSSAPGRVIDLGTHGEPISTVAFAPDAALILARSSDLVRLIDATSGATRASLPHGGIVQDAAFDPSGKTIATASEDGSVALWSVPEGLLRARVSLGAPAGSLFFSPCGTRLLAASSGGPCSLIDVERGAVIRSLEGHFGTVVAACISSDLARIFTASQDRTVRIWDGARGVELVQLGGGGELYEHLWLTPDGMRLVGLRNDGRVTIWDSAPAQSAAPEPPRDVAAGRS